MEPRQRYEWAKSRVGMGLPVDEDELAFIQEFERTYPIFRTSLGQDYINELLGVKSAAIN
jgi:hypothetical protein